MNYEEEFAPDPLSPTSEAAVGYRKLGIQVVPCSNKTKVPVIKWRHLENDLMSDDQFDALFGPGGQFANHDGIGMLTGKASGRVLMIDLDLYKGDSALQWWRGLMAVHNNGCDLETAEQITGGGGRQMFFTYPEGWVGPGNQKTSLNVDIRERGGFAVLPPTMHLSGRRYVWKEGFSPSEAGMMQAPPWLLEAVLKLCREHSHAKTNDHKHEGTEQAHAAGQDGFGNKTDGREEAMYRMVWGIIVDWRRASPINPGPVNSEKYAREKYAKYSEDKRPQKQYPSDISNDEALDAEGRGWTAWWDKWQRAMEQWDTKVAEQAAKPRPKSDNNNDNDNDNAQRARDYSTEFEKDPETGELKALLVHGKDFIAGYKPPNYVINGLLQKGYAYCLTGPAGHGKTPVSMYAAASIALGKECQGHKTKQGSVLFLAGENVDDIRARYIAMADYDGFNPNTTPFYFVCGVIDIKGAMPRIKDEAGRIGDLSMIVVDTDQAYFLGEEGNSNEQRKWYAKDLRALTQLPGNPCVLVNCHPVKNAGKDNLVPIGGSSFMNELDGNIMCWADDRTTTLRQHPSKWRGAPFEAMAFELKTHNSSKLLDENGDYMPSVVAVPISDDAAQRRADVAGEDDKQILRLLHADKKASMTSMAKAAGWTWPDGSPAKSKVQRVVDRLFKAKLIYEFHNGKYKLSKKGCRLIGVPLQDENDEE